MNLIFQPTSSKICSALVSILIISFQVLAQKDSADNKAGYTYGGISLIVGGAKTSDDLTFVPALTVAPGWRFIRTKEFSLSLEAPISAGFCLSGDNFFFGIELPATVNLNLGRGASDRSTSPIGWSVGIGKGYHFSYNEYSFEYEEDRNDKLSIWGTLVQTSFQFRDTRIRLHWLSNFSNQPVRKDVIGIGLLTKIH